MRRGLIVLVCGALALAACQSTKRAAVSTRDNVGRGAVGVRAGIGDAVTAPLEDLNLKRTKIPAILLDAEENPYSLDGMERCEGIAAEVARLDDALGPDMDEPPPPTPTRGQAAADGAADLTLSAVRNVTTDVIPMRGWVRRLTGAQKHSRHVQRAIRAGTMRRSYLKGVGMQKNCHPPAAPRWFVPRTQVRMERARPSRTAPVRRR
ncbi:hypothetical protein [Brevundimonas sp.]|uniref:hypothetical protein n=1 Tax=Brevundimonas sp. TaxID=1871086 RepID=UPI002D2BFABC|nr:hypothetical protein [Brevundimonas sp.]HYD27590.1 hypothetical protein [Brevundimonas sp.]